MKILFCTNKFDEVSNGPAKFANLILDINQKYPEHEIRVLTEDVAADVAGKVYKLDLHYPGSLRLLSQFFRMYQYHQKAMSVKNNGFDFDVLVYNNALVGLYSAFRFKNTVGMINDYTNAYYSWENLTFSAQSFRNFIWRFFEHRAAKMQKSTIVNSVYLHTYLKKSYPTVGHKIVVLYKSVELTHQEKPQKTIDKAREINILFVKKDYQIGGLFDLINALGRLPYRFRVMAIGPDASAKLAFEQVNTIPPNVNISFMGIKPQSFVYEALLNTDIFCVPSHMEALGVANIEALKCGVPVVSTNVGGIPEVMDNGRCGWLAEPGDPVSLAAALADCIEKEGERREKVEYGLQYCKKFDKEAMLDNFIQILRG